MFSADLSFNQSLDSWNVSQVTDMSYMFLDTQDFNQPLNKWNVSNVINMYYMFSGAISFNQPLDSWNVSQVNEMGNMFYNATLSTVNYDSLLIGWSSLPLKSYVVFNAGNSKYSSNASSARNYLISNFNWKITDNGLATAPSAPQIIQESSGYSYVTIYWSAPTSNGTGEIVSYNIFRSTISGSSYTLIGTTNSSTFSYTDNGAINGLTYYYVVQAFNSYLYSPNSNEISATPSIQLSAPSAARSLQASAGNAYVYLTWSAPTSDGGSTLTNYTIYRSSTSGSGYVLLTTVSSSTLSFNDTSVTNGVTYYYVVRANNAIGTSLNSNEVVGQPINPNSSTKLTSSESISSSSPSSSKIPTTSISQNSSNNSKTSKSSPGFEIVSLIVLLNSLVIINHRRRGNK